VLSRKKKGRRECELVRIGLSISQPNFIAIGLKGKKGKRHKIKLIIYL
jgi:hypothetical protein